MICVDAPGDIIKAPCLEKQCALDQQLPATVLTDRFKGSGFAFSTDRITGMYPCFHMCKILIRLAQSYRKCKPERIQKNFRMLLFSQKM